MKTITFDDQSELLTYAKQNRNELVVVLGVYDEVKQAAPSLPSNVVAASTFSQTYGSEKKETGFTGFTVERDICEVVPVADPPILSRHDLKNAYDKVKNNRNAFMYLILDGLSGKEDMVMTSMYFMDRDFKMIGGSAGDLTNGEALIYYGTSRVHHLALFVNNRTRTVVAKENIYRSMGKRVLVTDADPILRTVYTLNEQPAADEYARVLGISVRDLEKSFLSHPLGQTFDGDLFINSPQKVNSDGSISFYSEIIPNTFIDVLELGNIDDILEQTQQKFSFKPKTLLTVNCILRDAYFMQAGKWPTIFNSLARLNSNEAGFVSAGEQFKFEHVNQTMVLLGVE